MQRDRLFEIVYILLEGKPVTAGALAERLEVSQRTIYRDLEVLSGASVPVYTQKGRGGGIRLLPGFVLDKALLTNEEKVEIIASLRAVDAVVPLTATAALGKLSALFGSAGNIAGADGASGAGDTGSADGARSASGMDGAGIAGTDWIEVNFSSWSPPNRGEELFATLKTAILNRHKLRFAYASGTGKMSTRTVQPLKLGFRSQAWYLYAYCERRKADRFFKLARIRKLEVLPESFERVTPPGIFTDKPFTNEPFYDVKLRFSHTMAWHVLEEFESYEQTNDGDFVVEFRCPGGAWFFGYIAAFGASCEIVEPALLRKEFIAMGRAMLNRYEAPEQEG